MLCVCLCFTACTASVGLTFNIETGDAVKVELDVTGGHKLRSEGGRFFVEKDGVTVLNGVFLTPEMYDSVMNTVSENDLSIEDSNGVCFFSQEANGAAEYYYVFMVPDSITGILVGGNTGEADVREAFGRLTFIANEAD